MGADEGGVDALDDLVGALRSRRPAPNGEAGAIAAAPIATAEGPTRRQVARALALSLGAIAFGGFIADALGAAQLLGDAAPVWLALVWPLGDLGLLAAAIGQAHYVDRVARVSMLRALCLGYAAAFAVVGVLFASSAPTAIAAGLIWLLADQLNFLLPLVIWALAGDVFTAGQGITAFPWISRLFFVGKIGGTAVAAAAPWLFGRIGASLAWLVVVPLFVCLGVAVLMPRAVRGSGATVRHRGMGRHTLRETITFVRRLPSFNWLFWTSVVVLMAGTLIEFDFLSVAAAGVSGSGDLQTFYAAISLIGFVACWLIQVIVTPRVLRRWGVARSLGALPAMAVGAAATMVAAGAAEGLALAAVGLLLFRSPRWSIDVSARQAALATLPDHWRGRTSFLIDLVPFSFASVIVALPIVVAHVTRADWVTSTLAVGLAGVSVAMASGVARRWDDTQLSWRLKRRKRLS